MLKMIRLSGGRGSVALLVALLIVLTSFVSGASVAKATEVNGIQSSSIHLEKMDANEAAIYMWSAVRVNATWRVPNGTGRAGDTFMLTLPKELIGSEGSFDLKGKEGDPLAYGTCQVTKSEVVCTLNENVENKNDVGGSLWVKTQVGALTEADKLTFGLRNGVTVDVPPDGQSGIGYKPYVPTEIDKSGWFPGADQKIQWRIVVPGAKVSDRSSMTITDNFAMAGVDLTVAADSPSVFWVPSTPKCWNEISSADCYNALTTSSTPSSEVTIDNDGDTVKVVIDNKGQNFEADRIYIVDLLVNSDSKILAGSRYTNQATVDNEVRSATAVKETSGGGTGSGDTVGHIGVKKVVTGGDVASDTVYPVAWSYDYNGTSHQGELSVKGDGTLETLSNIPNGTVVTLTENVPSVTGVDFGDPAFSGDGVTDGVPNATSAQVAVEGLKTREVTLTNQVNQGNPKLASVQVTPGVCAPGAAEPLEPAVEVGPTDGITYTEPEITTSGSQVTIKVKATPAAGKQIDDQNLPQGWAPNGDGSFTFTTTITQPACQRTAVLAIPVVNPGICPADSTTPSQPTVTGVEDTAEIDYSEPVITVNGDEVTVVVTATAKPGYHIDEGNLPDGWLALEGTVSYVRTVPRTKCAVPVSPGIELGTCAPGAAQPSDPVVKPAETAGLTYSQPQVEIVNGKVTVTMSATVEDGYQLGGPVPEGWKRLDGRTATFTATKDQPVCPSPTPSPTPSATTSPTSPTVAPSANVPASTPAPRLLGPVAPTPGTQTPVTPTPVKPGLPRTGS